MKDNLMKREIKETNQRIGYAEFIAKRVALAVFDILAVYFSYFLALVMRFYVNGSFHTDAIVYVEVFHEIAPYLCISAILIFVVFGLYSNKWRYAGFHDLIRIMLAHTTLFVLLFAATYLFFVRMPLTFYFLGTAMLFCLICLSRFSLTIIDYLIRKYRSYINSTANVMIIGTGDTANYVRRLLENREEDAARVKCFFSLDNSTPNTSINGVPVLDNIEKIDIYLKKYSIEMVCFADSRIPFDTVATIKDICKASGVKTRDYSDVLEFDPYSLSFGKVMKHTRVSVKVRDGENIKSFSSAEEARRSLPASSMVESISIEDGMLLVDTSTENIEKNNINEEWVKKTEKDTGENISFF